MSATGLINGALAGFLASLDPLRQAMANPESLATFLREFGWDLPPADVDKVNASLASLAALPADPSSLNAQQLASAVSNLIEAVHTVASSGALAAFATTFPRELLDTLVYVALARGSASAFAVLHFVGVIGERRVAADAVTGRTAYVAREVHWERLPELATKPFDTIAQTYGWASSQFEPDAFLRSLGILVRAFGGRASLQPTDRALIDQYYEQTTQSASSTSSLIIAPPEPAGGVTTADRQGRAGIAVMVLPIPSSPTVPGVADGISLIPVVTGQASSTIPLADHLTLSLAGDFVARPVRAEMHPDRSVIRASAGDAHISAGARIDAIAPTDAPWILFGDTDSSRVEVGGAHASVLLTGQLDGDAELRVDVDIDNAALIIDFSNSDGFFREAVASSPTRTELAFSLTWSNKTGFSLNNSPQLQLSVPVRQLIGSIAQLDSVEAGLGPGPAGSSALDATVSGSVSIGPVRASFAQVGIRLLLEPRPNTKPAGNFGNVDLGFGFKAPSGLGVTVDTKGVLSGGGFLFHDEVNALYAGAMQLSLHEWMTLKAFGLIATRLPDGNRGYSMLVFITAEDFQPIPLGLGFTLLAIGGIVGVNRTFDQDVLHQGLKNGTLATLLFPRDPVGNATALIRSLASAFPARSGSYLLGLLAKIGWFTPTLILLDLALISEFGARERLLVLGRISASLPSQDNDLVRLNMEAVGIVDFNNGTTALDATLIDSRLAKKFPITGSGALRAGGASGDANFILSVGGFNPHYAPPANVPAINRVAIALSSGDNPRLLCDAYFAITANTVQFGAHASLYAAAADFSVSGDVGFDVLVQLAPLHFIADYQARLQLKCGSYNLFMVSLAGELEGPRPLRLSGKATFSILWCDFSVHFDATLVQGDPPPPPPAIDVFSELKEALIAPTSWSIQRASTGPQGVSLRSLPPESTTLVLDPLGQLTIKQQVVPLNTARDIDLFGDAPVSGARRFTIGADLGGSPMQLGPLQAPFAPAQYFEMSDDEKLAAPSFELMDAGYVIGSEATKVDLHEIQPAPLEYETITIDLESNTSTSDAGTITDYTVTAGQLITFASSGAVARAPMRNVGRTRFSNASAVPAASLKPKSWSILPLGDGAPVSTPETLRTWSEYQGVLKTMNRARANWQLVPAHELSTHELSN